ncbi:MAG: GNAT family N-acetyltransferase [Bdellovibrionota bacterium]
MNILRSWPLHNEFTIALVDELPTDIIRAQVKKYLAPEYPMIPRNFGLNENGIEKLKNIKAKLKDQFVLRLVVLHKDEIVGWTDGWQDSVEQDSFFMGASLVLPEYRKQGLYTALVNKVMELSKDEGFQSIWSLHVMTNNPVLIGKLKIGFHIYGFEVNTRYGALVRLVYHHSETKLKALKFRAGAIGESEISNELLKSKLL